MCAEFMLYAEVLSELNFQIKLMHSVWHNVCLEFRLLMHYDIHRF
jgi:hypothetical protein